MAELEAIEPWIGGLLAKLSAGERRKMAGDIGRMLRTANSKRIAANVQPDGSGMAPRKRRAARKSGRVKRKGRMFARLKLARNMKLSATPDQVEMGFVSTAIARVARVHQEGLVDRVNHRRDSVKVKYTKRELIGFAQDDPAAIMDIILAKLAPV